MTKDFKFSYTKYDSLDELAAEDRKVVDAAREACSGSFSPYSNFKVGAAALLESGKIVTGNNQESEVFPAGVCAERNLLYHHMGSNPQDKIVTMAVTSIPDQNECYPCGICRQILFETQKRQGRPIRLIMSSGKSATVVDSVAYLLPFTFEL